MTYTDFIRTFTHLEVNTLNSLSILYAMCKTFILNLKHFVVILTARLSLWKPNRRLFTWTQRQLGMNQACRASQGALSALLLIPYLLSCFFCLSWGLLLLPGGAWGCTVEPGRKVWLQADVGTTQVTCFCVLLSFFMFLYLLLSLWIWFCSALLLLLLFCDQGRV